MEKANEVKTIGTAGLSILSPRSTDLVFPGCELGCSIPVYDTKHKNSTHTHTLAYWKPTAILSTLLINVMPEQPMRALGWITRRALGQQGTRSTSSDLRFLGKSKIAQPYHVGWRGALPVPGLQIALWCIQHAGLSLLISIMYHTSYAWISAVQWAGGGER